MKPTLTTFIIMFLAATVCAIACALFKVQLATEILLIALTMIVFYIVGLVFSSTVQKVNKEAMRNAAEMTRQEMDQMNIDSDENAANKASEEVTPENTENSEMQQ